MIPGIFARVPAWECMQNNMVVLTALPYPRGTHVHVKIK